MRKGTDNPFSAEMAFARRKSIAAVKTYLQRQMRKQSAFLQLPGRSLPKLLMHAEVAMFSGRACDARKH